MLRALSHPDAHAEIELSLRAQIEIDGRYDLLLLIPQRIEAV
jgi:hypothetical protein